MKRPRIDLMPGRGYIVAYAKTAFQIPIPHGRVRKRVAVYTTYAGFAASTMTPAIV